MSAIEIRLCNHLLKPFGHIIQVIATYLIQNGPQTIGTLSSNLNYDQKTIKEAIFILLHHRLIKIKDLTTHLTQLSSATSSTAKLYSFNWINIEFRLYYPIWISIIKNTYGDLATALILHVFIHSITSVKILLSQFSNSTNNNNLDTAKEKFQNLLDDGYLYIIDSDEELSSEKLSSLSNEIDFTHPDYALLFDKEKRGRSSGLSSLVNKSSYVDQESLTMNKENKRVKIDRWEKLEKSLVTFSAMRFLLEMKHQALIKLIGERLNRSAGLVFKIILDNYTQSLSSRPFYETSPFPSNPYYISLFQIAQKLPPNLPLMVSGKAIPPWYSNNGNFMERSIGIPDDLIYPNTLMTSPSTHASTANLIEYLSCICQLTEKALEKCDSHTGGFQLKYSPDKASLFLRKEVLHSHIPERYGTTCGRIYRLLENKKILEEKQIMKAIKVNLKETREKLMVLYRDGFIMLQEVPRTPDHAPTRTIYLWKFESFLSIERLIKTVYKSMVNCFDRADFEKSSHFLLLSKAAHAESISSNEGGHSSSFDENSQELQASSGHNHLILNDTEKLELSIINTRIDRLDYACLSQPYFLASIKTY